MSQKLKNKFIKKGIKTKLIIQNFRKLRQIFNKDYRVKYLNELTGTCARNSKCKKAATALSLKLINIQFDKVRH